MKRALILISKPIDEAALQAERRMSADAGAVVYFLGVVRDQEANQMISALEYEAFHRMAEHQFNLIFDELEKRWPIESVRVVHRLGLIKVGEPSLWVEVITPHRAEAFAACLYLIDELKRLVPIWKKAVPAVPETSNLKTQPPDKLQSTVSHSR